MTVSHRIVYGDALSAHECQECSFTRKYGASRRGSCIARVCDGLHPGRGLYNVASACHGCTHATSLNYHRPAIIQRVNEKPPSSLIYMRAM